MLRWVSLLLILVAVAGALGFGLILVTGAEGSCLGQLPERWEADRAGAITAEPESNRGDQQLAQAVETRLQADPGVQSFMIHVGAENGVVTLSGRVDTLLARQRAVQLAQTIAGAVEIRDLIEVSPAEREDWEIAEGVRRALRSAPAIKPNEIDTRVRSGFVTLTGTVDSWEQKDLAELLATGVPAAKGVDNKLRVAYPSIRPDADIKADIVSRIRWDVWLQNVEYQVEVAGGVARLGGLVESDRARERLAQDAWVTGVVAVDASGVEVVPNIRAAMQRGKGRVEPQPGAER